MTAENPLRLFWLDPRKPCQNFPSSQHALENPDGLIAAGGDLTVSRLLRAYQRGIFPWFNPDEPILWWTPNPRAVLPPTQIHISRSLRKRINRHDYQLSFDNAFSQVMRLCAERPDEGSWLSPAMQDAYLELYRRGYAHSIEVWRDSALIGGLYGVALGRIFFGESMFSRAADGSKLAMVWLCRQLEAWQFALLDCQVSSPHLQRMGVDVMPRDQFERILQKHIPNEPTPDGKWVFDIDLPSACRTA
ncbi:MAG: leucyl/phenylalanyl-tRNA--protein transferase [Oceanococcus sp.]